LIEAWLAVITCRILLGEHVLYIGCIELCHIKQLFSSPFVLASSSVYQVHCSGLLLEVKVDVESCISASPLQMNILLHIIHHKLCPTIKNSAYPCLGLAVGRPWLALGEPFSLPLQSCHMVHVGPPFLALRLPVGMPSCMLFENHKHGSWLVGL